MTPEEAAALVGLHRRLRGDFAYHRGPDFSLNFDSGTFYWVLTRALLPQGWRWFSACVASSDATGDEAALFLGQSALVRFDRALRARDLLHEQCLIPQNSNTMDEAHFYLDVVLIQLSGVFDAVARVAHLAYGMKGSYDRAGFRKRQWRTELATHDLGLVTMIEEGKAARDALELVSLLRNTIHGEALQGIQVSGHLPQQRRQKEYVFRVPVQEEARFIAAVLRRGGFDRWGVRSLRGQMFVVAADRYVEALIPDAARAIGRLMRATKVENLAGAPARLMSRAPEGPESAFNSATRSRARLLAGI